MLDIINKGIIKVYKKDLIVKVLKERVKIELEVYIIADGYIRYYSKVYIPTN
jgi:alpha-galactosidase